uniref:(northern house mosquito) hypothetical protein n=1 Tax=Culex pipiens TaxID=7175 RepID=A0A8D8HWN2_CULPI
MRAVSNGPNSPSIRSQSRRNLPSSIFPRTSPSVPAGSGSRAVPFFCIRTVRSCAACTFGSAASWFRTPTRAGQCCCTVPCQRCGHRWRRFKSSLPGASVPLCRRFARRRCIYPRGTSLKIRARCWTWC